ncbi:MULTISPECIES: PQQ-binding-like beta-propeller repeat protein [unclassified Streptomyces]|uniref:hypothetical protein n=1 Tax=Streptomyces sp. NPDC127129 TaxID=3345373 RepID=UPI003626DDE5
MSTRTVGGYETVAGRQQGEFRGRSEQANALARFLRELTDGQTVRDLAQNYGEVSKTMWGEYRSGVRVIPWRRLQTVVEREVRDPAVRKGMLDEARRLHQAAQRAAVTDASALPAPRRASPPAPDPDAPGRAESFPAGPATLAGPGPGGSATPPAPDNPPTSPDSPSGTADGALAPASSPARRTRLALAATVALAVLASAAVLALQYRGDHDTARRPQADAPVSPGALPSPSATRASGSPSAPQSTPSAPPSVSDEGAPPRTVPAADATGPAYALASDGRTLLRWSGSGDTWATIGTGVGTPYAGKPGVFALDEKTGRVSRYNGTPNSWTLIGTASELALGGASLYALAPNRDKVLRWNGRAGSWTTIGGPAGHIYAGGAGLFATEPAYGHLIGYDSAKKTWTRVGNPGAHFVVGPHHLYGLNPARDLVWQWSGRGDTWDIIGGPARAIYGGELGLFAVNPQTGRLWQYTGEPRIWSDIGDSGADLAMDGHALYRVAADGGSVWRWSPANDWSRIGGPAAAVAAAG